ncbi:unnamed protein product [Rhizopus stolonifer]
MHPPLEAHKQEGCYQVIEALNECHRAGTFNKFIGTCNAAKTAVDACLQQEFLAQRKVNKEISKEKRRKMEAIWKEMEEPPTNMK